jgi:DMSO/TMAO reductase YedYZ heme-binding membrane subunit
MAVKLDIREPAVFGTILAVLLGWRWWAHREKKKRELAAA